MTFRSKSDKITSKKLVFVARGLWTSILSTLGGAGSSVGELFGPSEEGEQSVKSREMGEGRPGAGL